MTKEEALDGYDPVASGEQDGRGVDLFAIRANLELNADARLVKAAASSNNVRRFLDGIKSPRSATNSALS